MIVVCLNCLFGSGVSLLANGVDDCRYDLLIKVVVPFAWV